MPNDQDRFLRFVPFHPDGGRSGTTPNFFRGLELEENGLPVTFCASHPNSDSLPHQTEHCIEKLYIIATLHFFLAAFLARVPQSRPAPRQSQSDTENGDALT